VGKFKYPQFTPAELDTIIKESTTYYQGGLSLNRPPYYEDFAGEKLILRCDNGTVLYYSFQDAHTLTWTDTEDGEPRQERYDALKADENIIFFEHIIEGSRPQQARMVVLDTDTHLVTVFFSQIGNQFSTREVDRDIVFGYADTGVDAPTERHSMTRDLIGKSIIWTYGPTFSIQHIYASEWYSCFADFKTFYGGTLLDSPSNYVKINDHIYIYSWMEAEGAGIQGFALMNLHTMHDVGCFFGINGDSKFECYTFGAVGEYVGQLTNLSFPTECLQNHDWPPVRPQAHKEGETA
jgi:hypothetical protein